MYQDFFSLTAKPFSISPDPGFLFLSERHKEAIAHLRHGLKGHGGFVLLTGEVGTGKTTICRSLVEEMRKGTDMAFILNPALTEVELIATICDDFKIDYQKGNLRSSFNELSKWLISNLQNGRHAIVLIDEAQHLSFAALEQLRLLTNIETNGKKPLQVILIGQTELQEKLKQDEFRPLAQRITARYHLLALTQQESCYYIQHRLSVAGSIHAIFEKAALRRIFKICKGVPRLTNILCDRSLLCAYTQDSHLVTEKMVSQVSKEVHFTGKKHAGGLLVSQWRLLALIALTVFTLIQAPKIIEQLGMPSLFEQLSQTDSSAAETELNWFDGYPQLNLSRTSYQDALVGLFSIWGYQTVADTVSCEQGSAALLTCYARKINLQQLKKLNYPAVVHLSNNGSESLYAVIYKIADDYQLLIDGRLIYVSEAWFEQYWTGDMTLLWKAPFALQGPIKFGYEGQEVTWLVNQLNKEQGWPNENKRRFDLRLLEQVSAFQREQGLMDDGIVGPRTLMPLMQLAQPDSPRLLQEAK